MAVGDEFSIIFHTELQTLNGRYRLVESKVGRGKNGTAQVAKILNLDTGEVVEDVLYNDKVRTFGTVVSEAILNVTHKDIVYGAPSFDEERTAGGKPDLEVASALMEALSHVNVGDRLTIGSGKPELNGNWKVKAINRSRGRYKQWIISLVDPTDEARLAELRTHTHSGAINDVFVEE